MKSTNIYISCPLTTPYYKSEEVIEKVQNLGYTTSIYKHGTEYSNKDLLSSDIMVFIPAENSFTIERDEISSGCKKEIEIAVANNMPIYLAYWKAGKILNIYNTKISEEHINGISRRYLLENIIKETYYEIY